MSGLTIGNWTATAENVEGELVFVFSGPRDTFEVREVDYPAFLALAHRAIAEVRPVTA